MALKSSGWQLEPDFRECLDARILILLIVASGDADPADQLPVFQDRIASADSDHPGAIGQRRHFWIVRNIVVPDMGGVPKRGGTPSLVDGNIDGEKRRVISALERAQVTGGVDDGDRSRDADCTCRGDRRVDEGDGGFAVDRGGGNGLRHEISFAVA